MVSTLDYEPLVPGTKLRLDFRVHGPGGVMGWVEVKTIIPTDKDDWEKYEAARESGRFPTNVEVLLDQQYLGGETWHDSYSARTHLLDCALATERKIEECQIDPYATPCTLVICSSGYKLPREEVANFAHFYLRGRHLPWDEFQLMERHEIEAKSIQLKRTIACVGYLERGTWDVRPDWFSWDALATEV